VVLPYITPPPQLVRRIRVGFQHLKLHDNELVNGDRFYNCQISVDGDQDVLCHAVGARDDCSLRGLRAFSPTTAEHAGASTRAPQA
jgi:hypothetical protein